MAEDEALRAHDWYFTRSKQAAESFQSELENAGLAISENPEMWSDYLYGTKRFLMKRFPFVIVYRVQTDRIEIIAVAHGRLRPGYWVNRIEDSM